jgi:hypothetical protein
VRAFARWLVVDTFAAWFAVAGPLLALAPALTARMPALVPCPSWAWLGGCSVEARVRLAGFLVTLMGVVLVAKGIRDTLKTFGAPSVRSRVAAWWGRRPRLFGRTIDLSGATSATATGAATLTLSTVGTARVGPPPWTSGSRRSSRTSPAPTRA